MELNKLSKLSSDLSKTVSKENWCSYKCAERIGSLKNNRLSMMGLMMFRKHVFPGMPKA